MAHVLAKLSDVKFENVKQKLEEDAPEHAEQGMYLEHNRTIHEITLKTRNALVLFRMI